MNKVRQILEFVMSLLGFLLNLKKKGRNGRDEGKEVEPPASGRQKGVPDGGQELFPAVVQPALPRLIPDGVGGGGFVGGPFGGGRGVFGSPVDTLGVRGFSARQKGSRQLPAFVGWGLLAYAAGLCVWKEAAAWM